jgi:lipoyl synthase
VFNHNVETVPRCYPTVRPQALYERSLLLLQNAADRAPGIPTKSGLMLGLGETDAEVRHLLADLRRVRVRILTLGQYLQPTPSHHPVTRYVRPEAFERWRLTALDMGFDQVAGGPFVRSSYRAGDVFRGLKD